MGSITPHPVPNALYVFPETFPDGVSQPRVCDFDDMVLRLVKWQPSVHGLTPTYSELAASRLGQLIEAPVVRGTIVYVEPALLPEALAQRLTQPFHIGFTFSPGQNFRETDYAQIKNTASLPAAAVQLAWLQIADQERHNQFLYQLEQVLPDRTTRKMSHFILIDQAFICGIPDWSSAALDHPESSYSLPRHLRPQVSMASLDPLIGLVGSLDSDAIHRCFDTYPESWNIGADLVEKVTDYMLRRRAHLGDILRANFP